MMFVKRGRLQIIYEVLSVARKAVGKTRIIYGCNLSYDIVQKYLAYVKNHGLLGSTNNNGKEVFQTTERGLEFIEAFKGMNGFFEES